MATACVQRGGRSSVLWLLALHTKFTVSLTMQSFAFTGRLPAQLIVLASTDVRRVLDPCPATAGVVT